jgi:hypothetical protein
MIDIKKALSQRCYIIFDSNEQLRKFVKDNNLRPFVFVGILKSDVIISVHADGGIVTLPDTMLHDYPQYHHTELTITDDGE